MTKLCTEMGGPEAICAASSVGDRAKSTFNILKTKPTDSLHAHIHFCYGRLNQKNLQEIQHLPHTLSCQREVVDPASTPSTKTFLKFLETKSTNSFENLSHLLLVSLSYVQQN